MITFPWVAKKKKMLSQKGKFCICTRNNDDEEMSFSDSLAESLESGVQGVSLEREMELASHDERAGEVFQEKQEEEEEEETEKNTEQDEVDTEKVLNAREGAEQNPADAMQAKVYDIQDLAVESQEQPPSSSLAETQQAYQHHAEQLEQHQKQQEQQEEQQHSKMKLPFVDKETLSQKEEKQAQEQLQQLQQQSKAVTASSVARSQQQSAPVVLIQQSKLPVKRLWL